ncbi:hypothetical protein BJ875DRAFT_449538 [Amylocarpus encephaloides]|uniref:Uncharacterized protein n=1 Tax=Amylocarpus encephaloides TaxID=45428 RepID=A0A9P8C9Y6_9HELO|nr:hypothetical protein BJ875DRAFT_449538 [Amylocarpus encephaloides]
MGKVKTNSGHPAIILHPNAREMKIIVDTNLDSPLIEYDEQNDTTYFSRAFLDELPKHARTMQVVRVLILLRDIQYETAGRRNAQYDLVKDLVLALNKFEYIHELHVQLELGGDFNFSQAKILAYFYASSFKEWTASFTGKDNNGIWQNLNVGSALDRRLGGWFRVLRARGEL